MKFRKNIKKIMPVVLCMVLLLRFLIPLTAWAADGSDNEKNRKLSNLHLYEVAESCESGYSTSDLSKMAVFDWEDEDCAVNLKTWFSLMLSNNDDFRRRFGGTMPVEDFAKNYRLYLFAYGNNDHSRNGYKALIVKKDIRICMRQYDEGDYTNVYVYMPYDYRIGYSGSTGNTLDTFNWGYLEMGGENTKKLSYSSDSAISMRGSSLVQIKGQSYEQIEFIHMSKSSSSYFAGITYTNIAMVDDASDVVKYIDMQDDSVAANKDSGKKEVGEGCDSFGWDSFDMNIVPESSGTSAHIYRLASEYKYSSYPKMVVSPEDYEVEFRFSVRATYKLKSQLIDERQFSLSSKTANLGKYPSSYSCHLNDLNFDNVSSGDVTFGTFMDGVTTGLEGWATILGRDVGDIVSVSDQSLYCTVVLHKLGNNAGVSSTAKLYKWSLSDFSKTDLSPNVTTSTTGEGTDKKVTEVVGNDEGKTVINITVNVTGGNGGDGGSGGNGGSGVGVDDDNSKSFWSILKGIVAFFKALLDGEDGLFPVIAAFFEFIPASFWTVVIGAVVIIAVIAIYRLLKKS